MKKPVIIAADSTCDLSPELIERYGVKIRPAGVIMSDILYHDRVDIEPDDIFKYYDETGNLARTVATNAAEYEDFFRPLVEQGYAIVMLNTSTGITITHNNALLAAEEFEDVYPVDSLNLSTGIALSMIKACELRDRGLSAKEIADQMRSKVKYVRSSFVIDKLDYLYKGGRCSALSVFGSNLLKIKPSIVVNDKGKMDVGKKYRGSLEMVIENYIKDTLSGRDDLDLSEIFITHSKISDKCVEVAKKTVESCASFKELHITSAGSVISAHCGPNTLGILFRVKEENPEIESMKMT